LGNRLFNGGYLLEKQFELLEELQGIDIQIEQLRRNITDKPLEIEKAETEFNAFVEASQEETAKLDMLKKERRSCECDLKEGEAKIAKSNENLMNIKSNKEYKAALKEIASFEKANKEIEDRILLCMENIEMARIRLTEKEREISERKEALEKEKKQIVQEIRHDEQQLASMMERRNQSVAKIDQELIKQYDQLQKRGRILVVARAKNAVCLGCNMSIPPQLYNEIQVFDSIKLCPYCQRILYYKQEDESVTV
jgi:predicted  nucleic acid-binding Zn-ribbon protein